MGFDEPVVRSNAITIIVDLARGDRDISYLVCFRPAAVGLRPFWLGMVSLVT